jgi:hypothetical protein
LSSDPVEWEQERQIAQHGPVSKRTQQVFLRFYARFGHFVRLEIGDDLALVDVLRVLLRSYEGPAVTLYRGEGDGYRNSIAVSLYQQLRRRNRKPQSLPYGISWTTNREAANDYTMSHRFDPYRGGVILQTLAPPEAIICRVPLSVNSQDEYVVDPRCLQGVERVRLPNEDHWSMNTLLDDGWEDPEDGDDVSDPVAPEPKSPRTKKRRKVNTPR